MVVEGAAVSGAGRCGGGGGHLRAGQGRNGVQGDCDLGSAQKGGWGLADLGQGGEGSRAEVWGPGRWQWGWERVGGVEAEHTLALGKLQKPPGLIALTPLELLGCLPARTSNGHASRSGGAWQTGPQ